MHAAPCAKQIEISFAEVGLCFTWRPVQIKIGVFVCLAGLFELSDVAVHCRFAHDNAALLCQALVYSPGCVSLLFPVASVFVKPRLNQRPVGVELGSALLLGGKLRREVILFKVFVDGVARDARSACNIRDTQAISSQLPYRIDCGHADHFPSCLSVRFRRQLTD